MLKSEVEIRRRKRNNQRTTRMKDHGGFTLQSLMKETSLRFLGAKLASIERENANVAQPKVCSCRNGGDPFEGIDGQMWTIRDPACRVHERIYPDVEISPRSPMMIRPGRPRNPGGITDSGMKRKKPQKTPA